jgi:hypothetical protein
MMVKPFQFIAKNRCGLIQPAIKCCGRDIFVSSIGRSTLRRNISNFVPEGSAPSDH